MHNQIVTSEVSRAICLNPNNFPSLYCYCTGDKLLSRSWVFDLFIELRTLLADKLKSLERTF